MVNHPFINFVSDLVTYPVIYPPNLADIDEIVKPFAQGSNWRLIIYLSLLHTNFDDFYNAFRIILDQIESGDIASQYSYVLIDALKTKIFCWKERFDPIVELASLTIPQVLNMDIYSMKTVSSLLEKIIEIQPENEFASMSWELFSFLQSKLTSFKISNKQRARTSVYYKRISMLCQQLNLPPESNQNKDSQNKETDSENEEDDLFHVEDSESNESDYYSSSESSE